MEMPISFRHFMVDIKTMLIMLRKSFTLQGIFASIVSIVIFSFFFRWEIAVLLFCIMVVHELGHVYAMIRVRVYVHGIYFIPLIGMATVTTQEIPTRRDDVYISLMGPLWGLGACLAVSAVGQASEMAIFAQAAFIGAVYNALQLFPIPPLDGARVLKATLKSFNPELLRSFYMWSFIVGLFIGLFILHPFVGVLILLFAHLDRKKEESLRTQKMFYYENPEIAEGVVDLADRNPLAIRFLMDCVPHRIHDQLAPHVEAVGKGERVHLRDIRTILGDESQRSPNITPLSQKGMIVALVGLVLSQALNIGAVVAFAHVPGALDGFPFAGFTEETQEE